MGVNFYTKEEKCPTCGVAPKQIHLGKASAGWRFSFQYNGGIYYTNVEEMKNWLVNESIVDEYGEDVSHEAFWKMVDDHQKKENKSHYRYMQRHHPLSMANERKIDGYSFTDGEFS